MLPEVFDGLLVPSVLAGILWMFIAGVLFKFGHELSSERKTMVMVGLSVFSGALVALVNTLPPEQFDQLAQVYGAVRPLLNFILLTVLGSGTAFVTSQGAYRGYRWVVPERLNLGHDKQVR